MPGQAGAGEQELTPRSRDPPLLQILFDKYLLMALLCSPLHC